jgi:hypothetical protein
MKKIIPIILIGILVFSGLGTSASFVEKSLQMLKERFCFEFTGKKSFNSP